MKKKIVLMVTLLLVTLFVSALVVVLKNMDMIAGEVADLQMEGYIDTTEHTENLTTGEMKDRVESYLKGERDIPLNEANSNVVVTKVLSGNNSRNVLSLVALLIIIVAVIILWVIDNIRRKEIFGWKNRF